MFDCADMQDVMYCRTAVCKWGRQDTGSQLSSSLPTMIVKYGQKSLVGSMRVFVLCVRTRDAPDLDLTCMKVSHAVPEQDDCC